MAELLLELFSEEIPARMQAGMAADIETNLGKRLEKEGLYFKSLKSYVTPRRVVLVAEDMSLTQEDKTTERKGPRTDAPQQAIDGFLRSTGLRKDQLIVKNTDKGDFYFAVVHEHGRPTKEILSVILEDLLNSITWPKSMRWADYDTRWVRPLHNIACVFGGEVLPLKFGHLIANDNSSGHRFLGKKRFKITDFRNYREKLAQERVILDSEERKKLIWEQATQLAEAKNLTVHRDEGLLEEVAGLVEFPNVLMGTIDHNLMNVPEEVLISSIRTHQKYFVTRDRSGKLAPHFIIVSNMQTADRGKAIIAGNERVLRARLSDAAFFWNQDRKKNLEDWAKKLDKVIFHAKLGTVAEKVKRLTHLAKLLDVWIPRAHFDQTERAAKLCKADLVTEMVGEFPELQGVMGRYYAIEQGEPREVADAIKEHYSPLGPNDVIPQKPVSIALAIADKVDTLAGMFAINEKPTGSKDPYALRRAALGIIRIILENEISLPLKMLIDKAVAHHPKSSGSDEKGGILGKIKLPIFQSGPVVEDLMNFFVDRLKVVLKDKGIRHDLIEAVFAADKEDNLLRLVRRAEALQNFLANESGANLLTAYRRAANILRIEEAKDNKTYKGKANPDLFNQVEEQKLFAVLRDTQDSIHSAIKQDKFVEAMDIMSTMRGPVDNFFDQVTVNVENQDVRKNRLVMLASLRNIFDEVADFGKIESGA